MEWRDQGILLGLRRHGEGSAIIDVLTEHHGRHSGIVRGGASRKIAPILQQGVQLDLTWRARLDTHLGTFTVEPLKSRAYDAMNNRLALAGLNAICAMTSTMLAERIECPDFYRRTGILLDLLPQAELLPLAYVQWELTLMHEIGFTLDLDTCAVSGGTDELVYISPKSGRAVSRGAAGEWADRLLPLPQCLRGLGDGSDSDVLEGLRVLDYFWTHKVLTQFDLAQVPSARARFVDMFDRTR